MPGNARVCSTQHAQYGQESSREGPKALSGERVACSRRTVVQIGIHHVDRGKFDSHTLLGVIVCVTPSTTRLETEWYTVALRHCVLRDRLADYDLAALSLTPGQAGLEHCLTTWQEMPVQGPRAAARSESHLGGQGVLRCACHGVCSRRCKCKREGRVCTIACRCNICAFLDGII